VSFLFAIDPKEDESIASMNDADEADSAFDVGETDMGRRPSNSHNASQELFAGSRTQEETLQITAS
jgi:hypothetical protein